MRTARIWVTRVEPGVWWVIAPAGHVIDGQAYVVFRSGAAAIEFVRLALRTGLVRAGRFDGWAEVA